MSATRSANARPVKGSKEARFKAAVVLETLGGLRTAAEAADVLGVAAARYYVLERRAVLGMIEALEQRPRGRRRTLEAELVHARRELEASEQELARYQTLYRASQRAFGVPAEEPHRRASSRKKSTRTRRKRSRAQKVLSQLENPAPPPGSASDAQAAFGKEG